MPSVHMAIRSLEHLVVGANRMFVCRAAFHWDNAELEKSLMVRPLGDAEHGGDCEWQWSGGFNLSTR